MKFKKWNKKGECRFYKTLAFPILTLGSEAWALTTEDERRFESTEMALFEIFRMSNTSRPKQK
jgi:hypothetical protein